MDGLVRCPRCWKHTPAGARFCPRCGTSLTLWPAVNPRPPVARQPKPPSGGGITALLMFLVVGAFGLLMMLFVTSTTHAPIMVPPTPPPAQDVDPGYPQVQPGVMSDRQQRAWDYEHRWDRERHRPPPPGPGYPPYESHEIGHGSGQ